MICFYDVIEITSFLLLLKFYYIIINLQDHKFAKNHATLDHLIMKKLDNWKDWSISFVVVVQTKS